MTALSNTAATDGGPNETAQPGLPSGPATSAGAVSAVGTVPPRPLFGVFDSAETFAATDDLDAAVAALRASYPDIADVPIAVPTNAPPNTTVRFLGTITSDHQASVLTIVNIDDAQVFEMAALADPVMCAPSPGLTWRLAVIRGDPHGCVAVPPPGGSEYGQWTEGGEGWWYGAELLAAVPANVWLTGLRIIPPA